MIYTSRRNREAFKKLVDDLVEATPSGLKFVGVVVDIENESAEMYSSCCDACAVNALTFVAKRIIDENDGEIPEHFTEH